MPADELCHDNYDVLKLRDLRFNFHNEDAEAVSQVLS